jgi:hypothetical protein
MYLTLTSQYKRRGRRHDNFLRLTLCSTAISPCRTDLRCNPEEVCLQVRIFFGVILNRGSSLARRITLMTAFVVEEAVRIRKGISDIMDRP